MKQLHKNYFSSLTITPSEVTENIKYSFDFRWGHKYEATSNDRTLYLGVIGCHYDVPKGQKDGNRVRIELTSNSLLTSFTHHYILRRADKFQL